MAASSSNSGAGFWMSSFAWPELPTSDERRFSLENGEGCRRFIWVWLKIKELGLRGFSSLVPFTKVPCWYHFFEPQPYG